ncbi:MAG: cysteine--tRNA ligase, partial [Actinobacteria bacterium]|nr:cysteine--tRNA ligase [Actinomycetota bacterium]
MAIHVHDQMRRKKVALETRDPGRVAMYTCGPTVYNLIHVGNARTFLWFDFIRRYLIYRGYDVIYVMNYTDVDDRIIERAAVEGVPTEAITSKYSKAFEDDMAALGVGPPDIIARATDHIEDMVEGIYGLIKTGSAYESEGDVFFSVESFDDYGKLSGRTLDDMRAGERVEVRTSKRHPLDFALWKSAKEGEPSWPSPWGPGRPGWHIECSVMSTKYLGMGFDIHGGASDLTFPHHENEIAQAEALSGNEPFVRNWLHAGLVQFELEKMSKSLGNTVLARDVTKAYPRPVARYWALMGSYRTQLTFSDEALADAAQGYERWTTFLAAARHALGDAMPRGGEDGGGQGRDTTARPFVDRFVAALDDDFNTAEGFAVVHDLVREGNRLLEDAQSGDEGAQGALAELAAGFFEMTAVMGFEFEADAGSPQLVGSLVEYLLEIREDARKSKDFEAADAIRSRLVSMGVAIEDTASGARWRLSTSGAPEPSGP